MRGVLQRRRVSHSRPAPSLAPPRGPTALLFASGRELLLRLVTLVCFAPVPLTIWLLSLAPRAEWEAALGPGAWWVGPASLVALSLVLPGALLWLHDRYVLRLVRCSEGLRLTTFLVWGRRTRVLAASELKSAAVQFAEGRLATGVAPVVNAPSLQLQLPGGRRLIFDAQGDAPEGWEAIYALGRQASPAAK